VLGVARVLLDMKLLTEIFPLVTNTPDYVDEFLQILSSYEGSLSLPHGLMSSFGFL